MKPFKLFLVAALILSFKGSLLAWTSSNEGICYTMDTLTVLSPGITYNGSTGMYEITTDIIILENDTLNILPGEILKFISNNYNFRGIKIYGCLIAIGNPQNKIILGDPMFNLSSGYIWNGIKFYDTAKQSILKNCIIRGATDQGGSGVAYLSSLYCENSSPIIDHCTICYTHSPEDTGGGIAISCKGQSYPIISYCQFEYLINSIVIWCNPWTTISDTINYPSPLVLNCNIMPTVTGFFYYPPLWDDIVVYKGGFLDNCYLGVNTYQADTTLGFPIDTMGDGICSTTSSFWLQRFMEVDGVVHPRGDTLLTGINEEETEILPTTSQFLTLSNYPNPFSGSTTIEFEIIGKPAAISLLIFNSKGNRVKQIINNENFPPGTHKVNWYGNNETGEKVGSGIYFYKLISDNKMLVKKAIMVR